MSRLPAGGCSDHIRIVTPDLTGADLDMVSCLMYSTTQLWGT